MRRETFELSRLECGLLIDALPTLLEAAPDALPYAMARKIRDLHEALSLEFQER